MEKLDREIPQPRPFVQAGIRYEAVRNARKRGFSQAGGVLAATDLKSGKEIWVLKLYDVAFKAGEETDAQEIFITRIRASKDKSGLLVEAEDGRRYRVGLDGGKAVELK